MQTTSSSCYYSLPKKGSNVCICFSSGNLFKNKLIAMLSRQATLIAFGLRRNGYSSLVILILLSVGSVG